MITIGRKPRKCTPARLPALVLRVVEFIVSSAPSEAQVRQFCGLVNPTIHKLAQHGIVV